LAQHFAKGTADGATFHKDVLSESQEQMGCKGRLEVPSIESYGGRELVAIAK
jgi:hypothetical protein